MDTIHRIKNIKFGTKIVKKKNLAAKSNNARSGKQERYHQGVDGLVQYLLCRRYYKTQQLNQQMHFIS
jgi:hypothetical protein